MLHLTAARVQIHWYVTSFPLFVPNLDHSRPLRAIQPLPITALRKEEFHVNSPAPDQRASLKALLGTIRIGWDAYSTCTEEVGDMNGRLQRDAQGKYFFWRTFAKGAARKIAFTYKASFARRPSARFPIEAIARIPIATTRQSLWKHAHRGRRYPPHTWALRRR